MPRPEPRADSHRTAERHRCPPFFSARISSGGVIEENAGVEDLNLRGLSASTSCIFEKGCIAEIELKSTYSAPVKIRARVTWVKPAESAESRNLIGFSVSKIRIFDWFRLARIVAQIRKEVW
jgi:hypothetical protein